MKMNYRHILHHVVGSEQGGYVDLRRQQLDRYRSGRALAGHAASAHGGVVDLSCQACRELKAKQESFGPIVDSE